MLAVEIVIMGLGDVVWIGQFLRVERWGQRDQETSKYVQWHYIFVHVFVVLSMTNKIPSTLNL